MSSPESEGQFETPTDDAQQSEETAGAEFAVPPTTAEGEQAAFAPDPQALSGVSTQLLDARAAVEDALLQQDRATARVRSVSSLTDGGGGLGNVEGVAIGLGEPGDGPPGQPTLNVYVAERATVDEVRAVVVDGLGVQAAGDMPITVRRSGQFDAQPHRFRIRPAPGGVSVGHVKITAGTIGCLSLGRSAPRNARLMILSNNHVLANSNNAAFGDSIIQPGRYDGGTHPADQIAILERFVPIQFGGARNYVDAATGWCWPDRVRRELIYPSGGSYYLFRIGSNPVYPVEPGGPGDACLAAPPRWPGRSGVHKGQGKNRSERRVRALPVLHSASTEAERHRWNVVPGRTTPGHPEPRITSRYSDFVGAKAALMRCAWKRPGAGRRPGRRARRSSDADPVQSASFSERRKHRQPASAASVCHRVASSSAPLPWPPRPCGCYCFTGQGVPTATDSGTSRRSNTSTLPAATRQASLGRAVV